MRVWDLVEVDDNRLQGIWSIVGFTPDGQVQLEQYDESGWPVRTITVPRRDIIRVS